MPRRVDKSREDRVAETQAEEGNLRGNRSASWTEEERSSSFQRFMSVELLQRAG